MRPFLRWAIHAGHAPKLQLPPTVEKRPAPISQQQRIALIRRIHRGQDMEPADCVIALLILLYAQPPTKIVRLTVDDVVHDGDQVLLRLGDPPVPIPVPFAEVLTRYIDERSNLTTATNTGSRLLFPGRRAGQPLHPTSVRLRLHTLGIPNLNGRTRAIRELLRQAPAAVVAGMLGYGQAHAEQLAAEAGGTRTRYAAGSHHGSTSPRPE